MNKELVSSFMIINIKSKKVISKTDIRAVRLPLTVSE